MKKNTVEEYFNRFFSKEIKYLNLQDVDSNK